MQNEIYKKQSQEVPNLAGVEFNSQKNISHYVNDRTDDWNQSLEETQGTYWT